MNNVYVTNFSGYDYSSAQKFGELIHITKGFVDLKYIKDIQAKVKSFIDQSNKDDFLLLSGNTLLCAVCVNLWLEKHKTCRVLHWNSMVKEYNEYLLPIEKT